MLYLNIARNYWKTPHGNQRIGFVVPCLAVVFNARNISCGKAIFFTGVCQSFCSWGKGVSGRMSFPVGGYLWSHSLPGGLVCGEEWYVVAPKPGTRGAGGVGTHPPLGIIPGGGYSPPHHPLLTHSGSHQTYSRHVGSVHPTGIFS